MTMGIKVSSAYLLGTLNGEFIGNCYDLQVALNKTPPSLNDISQHFIRWNKMQGIYPLEYQDNELIYPNNFTQKKINFSNELYKFYTYFNAVPSIRSRLAYNELSASEPHPYIRFWHGYQILTRPVLAFLGLENLRFICGCFFILTLGYISHFLTKKINGISGKIIGVIFLILMLISLDIKEIFTNFIHAIILSSVLLSAMVTVNVNNNYQKILAGFWAMYFSFLINLQIGVIMIFWLSWIIYQPKFLVFKEYKPIFKNMILWALGISFSFIYKFLLLCVIFPTQENFLPFARALWSRSIAGHSLISDFIFTFFSMLGANLKFWSFLRFRFWMILLFVFLIFIYQIMNFKKNKPYLQINLFIIFLLFASMTCLLNHSFMHSIFTWRIMSFTSSLLILTGLIGMLKKER
jgi:hypothetical protein